MNLIDPNNPTPLYEQLKQTIQNQIVEGDYAPGSHLPSEAALCEKYSVSRITVGRALNDLERAGFVQRVQGSGTIVIYPRYDADIKSIKGFNRTVREAGNTPSTRILSIEEVKGSETLLKIFRLPATQEETFFKFRRLRYVNDNPGVIMTSFVRRMMGWRMQQFDLETASFYSLFQEITGLLLIRNEASLTPIVASGEIAKFLGVKLGSPHFLFRGVSFVEGDIPVEYNSSVFHGNIFQFTANIYTLREDQFTRLEVPSDLIEI